VPPAGPDSLEGLPRDGSSSLSGLGDWLAGGRHGREKGGVGIGSGKSFQKGGGSEGQGGPIGRT